MQATIMKSVRFVLGACAVLAVAACQPEAPEDSRFGVGFDQTFDTQRANRDAALAAGNGVPAAPSVSAQPLPASGSAADTAVQTTALFRPLPLWTAQPASAARTTLTQYQTNAALKAMPHALPPTAHNTRLSSRKLCRNG